jgi:hypothetical protein
VRLRRLRYADRRAPAQRVSARQRAAVSEARVGPIAPKLTYAGKAHITHRCPERDKSVPRTPDPAMAFPQLMRVRSGQRDTAPLL